MEDFTYDDVYWVITVPAIWDLKAKQFMRRTAEKVMKIMYCNKVNKIGCIDIII